VVVVGTTNWVATRTQRFGGACGRGRMRTNASGCP